jgi:hypothetical protein
MPIRGSPDGARHAGSRWSRSPGMGGRHPRKRAVAINRNHKSRSSCARTGKDVPAGSLGDYWRFSRQHRQRLNVAFFAMMARKRTASVPFPTLTVLTVCHGLALILMIRLPAWPSRLKATSMPSARKEVCARRSRPASARGFWASRDGAAQFRPCCDRRRPAAVGGTACPRAAHGHQLAHAGGHRVGVDGVFDRDPAIGRIGADEGPGGPQGGFAGRRPEREISHLRAGGCASAALWD